MIPIYKVLLISDKRNSIYKNYISTILGNNVWNIILTYYQINPKSEMSVQSFKDIFFGSFVNKQQSLQ